MSNNACVNVQNRTIKSEFEHFCPVPVCFEVARHIEVAGVKKADVTESVVTKVRIGHNMMSKRKDVREYNAASGREK